MNPFTKKYTLVEYSGAPKQPHVVKEFLENNNDYGLKVYKQAVWKLSKGTYGKFPITSMDVQLITAEDVKRTLNND